MTLFLSQNVGGPALIFDRFQEAGSTTVGHKRGAPLTKKILGLGKVFFFDKFLYIRSFTVHEQMSVGLFHPISNTIML